MTENQELIVTTNTDLIAPSEVRSDSNPVTVYLAKLTSAHSKRTMGRALDRIADIVMAEYYIRSKTMMDHVQ